MPHKGKPKVPAWSSKRSIFFFLFELFSKDSGLLAQSSSGIWLVFHCHGAAERSLLLWIISSRPTFFWEKFAGQVARAHRHADRTKRGRRERKQSLLFVVNSFFITVAGKRSSLLFPQQPRQQVWRTVSDIIIGSLPLGLPQPDL